MPMIAPEVREEPEVARLLAAARAAVTEVPYCWVITAADGGNAHARVVKAFSNQTGEDWWTRWFLTRRLARKTTEIRNAGYVTLAFQHDSGKAYVSLAGRAELIDERPAVESRFLLYIISYFISYIEKIVRSTKLLPICRPCGFFIKRYDAYFASFICRGDECPKDTLETLGNSRNSRSQ